MGTGKASRWSFTRVIKFILIGAAATFLLLMISLFAISYQAVESLTKKAQLSAEPNHKKEEFVSEEKSDDTQSSEANSPLKESLPQEKPKKRKKSDSEFLKELAIVARLESIRKETYEKSTPDVCSILCNESQFDYNREKGDNPLESLSQFYEQEGIWAFEDPKFLLMFEKADILLFSVFTPAIRQLVSEVINVRRSQNEISVTEKAFLAIRFKKGILETIYSIESSRAERKERTRQLQQLKNLRKSCDQESRSEIYKKCQDIGYNF